VPLAAPKVDTKGLLLAKPVGLVLIEGGQSTPMRKGQLPVARRHDPSARSALPLLNFLRWLAVLGTVIFGNVTTWFFINQQYRVSIGFLVITMLLSIVWRVATRRLKLLARNGPL
jgi:hypothetical protein